MCKSDTTIEGEDESVIFMKYINNNSNLFDVFLGKIL